MEHVVKPLAAAIAALVSKREKIRATAKAVRSQLLVLVSAVIVNPTFDGQVKEMLTTPVSRFGSRVRAAQDLRRSTRARRGPAGRTRGGPCPVPRARALRRTDGTKSSSIRGIPKLCDAALAGGRKSRDCTLILTEGDSAKTMAISGLAAIPNGRADVRCLPTQGQAPQR